MEQKKPIGHIAAGLLISGLVIIISIAMTMIAGGATANKPGSGLINYLIIIGGLILFINLYAKSRDNYVTFGELFSYGFKATAVLTVVFVAFFIIFSLVTPDMKTQAIEAARQQMESQNATDDQIEQSINLVEKYFWVFAIGGTVLSFIIIGAIGSLLGAAFTKKRPKNPFEQTV